MFFPFSPDKGVQEPPAGRPVIFLMGPTAAGKSGLALALAAHFPLEIVNADSVQVYRGMDIGTAKPTALERQQAPHHLLDVVEPHEPYSAGRYRQEALAIMTQIHHRGHVPLLVGGTGLYFRVVEKGIADIPDVPEEIGHQIKAQARQIGWPALHERLAGLDPAWAARVTPNDGQRILRGLAVWQASGQTLTHWQQQGQSPLPHPLLKLVVNRPRPLLYEDINRRFLVMMEMGLLAEVKALVAKGLDRQLPAMKAVGYRQLLGHVLDGQPLDLAVTLAMQESRRYAKRQLTWLRGEENAHWLEDDPHQAAFPLVKQFLVEFGFSS